MAIYALLRIVYQPQDLGAFGIFTSTLFQAMGKIHITGGDVASSSSVSYGPESESLVSPPSYNLLNLSETVSKSSMVLNCCSSFFRISSILLPLHLVVHSDTSNQRAWFEIRFGTRRARRMEGQGQLKLRLGHFFLLLLITIPTVFIFPLFLFYYLILLCLCT